MRRKHHPFRVKGTRIKVEIAFLSLKKKKKTRRVLASDSSNTQLKTEVIKETYLDKIYRMLKNILSKKDARSVKNALYF